MKTATFSPGKGSSTLSTLELERPKLGKETIGGFLLHWTLSVSIMLGKCLRNFHVFSISQSFVHVIYSPPKELGSLGQRSRSTAELEPLKVFSLCSLSLINWVFSWCHIFYRIASNLFATELCACFQVYELGSALTTRGQDKWLGGSLYNYSLAGNFAFLSAAVGLGKLKGLWTFVKAFSTKKYCKALFRVWLNSCALFKSKDCRRHWNAFACVCKFELGR